MMTEEDETHNTANLGVAMKLTAARDPNNEKSRQGTDCRGIMALDKATANPTTAPNNDSKCNNTAPIKHGTAKLSSQKLPPPHFPGKDKGLHNITATANENCGVGAHAVGGLDTGLRTATTAMSAKGLGQSSTSARQQQDPTIPNPTVARTSTATAQHGLQWSAKEQAVKAAAKASKNNGAEIVSLEQDQVAKQVPATAGSQSMVKAQSMMPSSSSVPLKWLWRNRAAKVPPLETISLSPMEQGKSQADPESADYKPGDLDAQVGEEAAVNAVIKLAEDSWANEISRKHDKCQNNLSVSNSPTARPSLEEQLQPPTLRQSRNVQAQVQQPGAYESRPGGHMQRIDYFPYDIEAPIAGAEAHNWQQLLLTSGNHPPLVEEEEPGISPTRSIANIGLVEARAVTEESTMNMILPEAHQVGADELAEEIEFTTIRKQKERECRRVSYVMIAVSLAILASFVWRSIACE
jgi:hypothetical protein